MNYLKVSGGNKLFGSIKISGSKNAALPIICASLLTDDPIELTNVPNISDINNLLAILEIVGCQVIFNKNTAKITKTGKINNNLNIPNLSKLRASILLAGPLIARTGFAELALPGGCQIGERPFDEHLNGFSQLGIESQVGNESVIFSSKNLKGNNYTFKATSVTGTENVLMAAVLAHGKTIIYNAAKEPEVVELAYFLREMGAIISGEGTNTIEVIGVPKLRGCKFSICSDRIELGSFMSLLAATGGEVKFTHANAAHSASVIEKLIEMGCFIDVKDDCINMRVDSELRPVDVVTDVYPGFPTDLQAQFMALNATLKGCSKIVENIYENRFHHAYELKKMGASINIDGREAQIEGRVLNSAEVYASDLRAAAALVVAAASSNGTTIVKNLHYLDRGYENFVEKLKNVGVDLVRY